MKILFCGDVMPGGVLPYQNQYISPDFLAYMQGFDLRVGTLECAIGTDLPPAPEKLKENGGNNNVCFARDEDFFRIKELGFNIMSLGNNHSFDLGEEGLRNTIRHLEENGIGYFGAGLNKKEASKPYIYEKNGKKIFFVGCCIKGISPVKMVVATENSYGIYQPTIEELVVQIKVLKGQCDKLIIMPHWGEEHILIPPHNCVKFAKKMIEAGADAIFGSHSHRLSSNFRYKGKPIYFGLGNFLYPDVCLTPPRPFYYPLSSVEVEKIQRCINYPRSVSQKTMLVWSEDSRVGIAAEAVIDKHRFKVYSTLVRMGNDNILRFYKNEKKIKNFLFRAIVIPFANIVSSPFIYGLTKKLTWRMARLKLNYLGDFRKDI